MKKGARFGLIALLVVVLISVISLTYYFNSRASLKVVPSRIISAPVQAPSPIP